MSETLLLPIGQKPRAAAKVISAVIVILIFGEWLCRSVFMMNIEQLRFGRSDLYYYYDRAGFRHNLPNKIGHERMWNGQGRVEFRMNSLGFRGPEIPNPKPAGTIRILFLGDSITLGGRLPEDETFVIRVGKALSEAGSTHYEVINGGIGDVGLYEEEDALKTQGLKAQPDVVVLCWYLNDARPPIGFPEEVVYDNWLIRWMGSHPIFDKSYLAGFVYDTVRKSLVAKQLFQDRRFQWVRPFLEGRWMTDPSQFAGLIRLAGFDWGDAWNPKSMNWMEGKIRSLKEFIEARGMRFVVIAMPVYPQVYARFKSPIIDFPQEELAQYSEKNGIRLLNLLPLLRQQSKERLFYDNCHYTPHGNEVVARLIVDFLRKSGSMMPE